MLRIALILLSALTSLAVFLHGGEEIDVNVASLARVVVNGRDIKLNPASPVPRRFLDVVTDGFVDDQYLAEAPTLEGVATIALHFPWVVRIDELLVVGWSGGGPGTLEVVVSNSGAARARRLIVWSPVDGKPPTINLSDVGGADDVQLTFRGEENAVLNSVQCYVRCPRWKAWSWFLGMQVLGPWLFGGLWATAVFGWGELLRGRQQGTKGELGKKLLVGLSATSVLSILWLAVPSSWLGGWKALLPTAVLWAPGARFLVRRVTIDQRRFLFVLSATALFLVSTVAVDSTFVGNRRVKPMDHLFGLMTAEHLLERQPVPDEMVLRPWFVPALSIPTEVIGGRFGYWLYLGQMAWINVLGLALIASVAERWGLSPVFIAAMIGLSPLIVAYHFSGQRVLVAGLCLLAIEEWTQRQHRNWWWWGGWASAAGVLAHPGALFILPPAAIYFLYLRSKRIAALGFAGVGTAVGTYLLWTVFTATFYPDARNNLVYYPLMRTLDDELPKGNFREIVAALSADRWRELALNRLKQLRHYIWSDNSWQNALHERLRAVSLFSTLGAALTVFALTNLRDFRKPSVLWLGLIGPLLFFHLHIGQSFPQFHILPTPFFALAIIGLSSLQRFGRWATTLVVAEALLHHLFVPSLLLLGIAGRFDLPGWFVGDFESKHLSLVPLVPWVLLASVAVSENSSRAD